MEYNFEVTNLQSPKTLHPHTKRGSALRAQNQYNPRYGVGVYWTAHARAKMRFYGLSEQRVKRTLHSPKRVEEGIAPKTIAMMQPASVKTTAGKPAWRQEIWVMFQDMKGKRKIISAWRYPGITKPGEQLPAEILKEVREAL